MAEQKKIGRPCLADGGLVTLTLRVSKKQMASLRGAAAANGSSVSQEARQRLEHFFLADEIRSVIREELRGTHTQKTQAYHFLRGEPFGVTPEQVASAGNAYAVYACAEHGWRCLGAPCPRCPTSAHPISQGYASHQPPQG